MPTTLRGVLKAIREKHFRIAESSGSLGIIGIVALIIACVLLLWKPFLGRLSKWVAIILIFVVPLLNL